MYTVVRIRNNELIYTDIRRSTYAHCGAYQDIVQHRDNY